MASAKSFLLHAYYYSTLPARRWQAARLRKNGRMPVVLLYYHRVADTCPNGWTLSRHEFTRHVHWLKNHVTLISLADALRRVRSNSNDEPCVSITFDDGYAENCQYALPLLMREKIPFTYFVSTRHVLEGIPFAHDVQAEHPLPINTPQQLRALADAGVEIGAHTRNHADLGAIRDPERLHDEIVVCRHELQMLTGRPVRYFAFPFGLRHNLSREAFRLAKEAGYDAVCSAYGGFNFPGDDPFHLHRCHGDTFLIRVKNLATFDPRKLRTPRYDYN